MVVDVIYWQQYCVVEGEDDVDGGDGGIMCIPVRVWECACVNACVYACV